MDVKEFLGRMGEHLAVGRAFGPPYEHGDAFVIPVAVVAGGAGGGDAKAQEAEGGGFGGIVYPLGAYVIREGDVRFLPSFDATLLIAGALLLLRLLVKGIRRT